ncbi:MAG: hypothetical protein KDE15_10705 [Erythrobacter sp.]|nr:hypothetical protein [Erythrobacter sp.]
MRRLLPLILLALASPLAARDSLGVFGQWGAFRDPDVPRCYAIAMAEPSRERRSFDPYASVGTWPDRRIRGQLHFHVSRELADAPRLRLVVGGSSFELTGGGSDAWAADAGQDAAILAAMRAGSRMTLSATDSAGRRFTDSYRLEGAATAIDAAVVGCARTR